MHRVNLMSFYRCVSSEPWGHSHGHQPSSVMESLCPGDLRAAGGSAGLGKQGGQWAEFLWGLIIGLQLSLASYVFGQHCALCIDYYLVPGGSIEADLEDRERE